MEDNNTKKIEEEIRQYKLFKIQTVKAKIREYENIFNKIKENIVIKFTKNATSNLIIILFLLIVIVFLISGIFFMFPEQVIKAMERKGEVLLEQDKNGIMLVLPYLGYLLISISVIFGIISLLLKKNIRKRNTIYNLSKLIKEVIDYMSENVEEDKKKYAYFVDSIADIENRKKNNNIS